MLLRGLRVDFLGFFGRRINEFIMYRYLREAWTRPALALNNTEFMICSQLYIYALLMGSPSSVYYEHTLAMNPYPTLWMYRYIFHCKRDNSGVFQWLADVWISSSLIGYLQLCNNLNIKNLNFLFITDEEEKISFINFVLKNLIESLSYLIIYNWKLTRNCDEFQEST